MKSFLGNFYRHLAIFSGLTGGLSEYTVVSVSFNFTVRINQPEYSSLKGFIIDKSSIDGKYEVFRVTLIEEQQW